MFWLINKKIKFLVCTLIKLKAWYECSSEDSNQSDQSLSFLPEVTSEPLASNRAPIEDSETARMRTRLI